MQNSSNLEIFNKPTNMKTFATSLALVFLTQLSSCEELSEKEYELRVEIVDDKGKPVPSATVQAARQELIKDSPVPMTRNIRLEFSSDETGIALIKFKSMPTPGGVAIHKQNFYSSFYAVEWKSTGGIEGKLHKGEIKAVLKPVKNPIPLHANSMVGAVDKYIFIPEADKDYGYDLMLAQPLPPLGAGKTADFVFRVEGSFLAVDDHDLALKISFPDKDAGIIEFLTPQRKNLHELHMEGSLLISPYEAPDSGYNGMLTRHSKQSGVGDTLTRDRLPERNFSFRTRIKRDTDGHILSSHYGKIYGDFDFRGGNMNEGFIASFGWAATYFNPTLNDRNVEFDPKHNLNPAGNVQRP